VLLLLLLFGINDDDDDDDDDTAVVDVRAAATDGVMALVTNIFYYRLKFNSENYGLCDEMSANSFYLPYI